MAVLHPTKEALILTAVDLLAEHSPADITSDLVLERSKISRGSLYHHFHDFNELIEDAQIRRFANYIDASIAIMWEALSTATSHDELLARVYKITEVTQSNPGPRANRVSAIALTVHNPRMREKLGAEQGRLTDSIADLYREVCNKGWGDPTLDPRVVSTFIQAYTLGKVIDDFAVNRVSDQEWNSLINRVIATVLFPKKG
jgi:AcrR family transcriptional regulator